MSEVSTTPWKSGGREAEVGYGGLVREACFNDRRVGDFPSRTGLHGAWRGSLIFRGLVVGFCLVLVYADWCWDWGVRGGSAEWEVGVGSSQ